MEPWNERMYERRPIRLLRELDLIHFYVFSHPHLEMLLAQMFIKYSIVAEISSPSKFNESLSLLILKLLIWQEGIRCRIHISISKFNFRKYLYILYSLALFLITTFRQRGSSLIVALTLNSFLEITMHISTHTALLKVWKLFFVLFEIYNHLHIETC